MESIAPAVEPTEAPKLRAADPVVLEIWVRAGGWCEFCGCQEYLMQERLTRNNVKLGHIAHIVARRRDGPRGDDPLPISRRNDPSNLLLACPLHHGFIDNKEMVQQYPAEELRRYKIEHEDRIRYLTGFGVDHKTVVLRMLGGIRGDSVAISTEHVRKATLLGAQRYPSYLASESTLEIDLLSLPQVVDDVYWRAGVRRIDEEMTRMHAEIASKRVQHLSVFAFTRIPLLMYLGSRLGDKVPVDIYQKHRGAEEDWTWRSGHESLVLSASRVRAGSDTKVALILSLSGKVHIEQVVNSIGDDATIFEIAPAHVAPSRELIQARHQLDSFRAVYQTFLRMVERDYPQAKQLHTFPATPLSAAIVCGRELLRDISPKLLIYERADNGKYLPTLEV
jgi:hypothetical protein